MKKSLIIIMLLAAHYVAALPKGDPRSIQLMGIPIEGHIDTLKVTLKEGDFTEWGKSDDGEDYYFRGNFYGIRAKLMVSTSVETGLVQSAYVTVGPYSTKDMLQKNLQYFLYKMQKDYGRFTERNESWFYMDDFGNVKLSLIDHDNGSRSIGILLLPTVPYYKDAISMGLRGNVQEVVTQNAVAEDQFLHFHGNGQAEDLDLIDRQYDRHGYLLSARIQEKDGFSMIEYSYDDDYRLVRRTLENKTVGIRYVNDYTYNDQDEPLLQQQKVFDQSGECIMTINMRNNYLTRDDNGNWTSNSLSLTYWEKGSEAQNTTVLQKRTLTYWE